MRICFVCNLFPPDVGGPATYVPKLAADLARRAHLVQVVVGAPPRISAQQLAERWSFGVRRISRGLPLPLRLARFFVVSWQAARTADVVYVNGLAGPELVALLAARLAGRPVALKVVGDFAWEYAIRRGWTADGLDEFQTRSQLPQVNAVRTLVRTWARLASAVIVPSSYLAGVVTRWGLAPDRVRVIRNALTFDEIPPLERAAVRLDLDLEGRVLVSVARLYPWKNLDFLIRLLPDLPADVHLVLVGDGPELRTLEALADTNGVASRVHFTGSVSPATVQRYLRAADLFVLDTRYEGLSHAILEAMACGVPVIASRVGGNVELLDHGRTGLLLPLDDREGFLAAIRTLLARPGDAARLASAAQAEVRRYNWLNLVDATERALLEIANHPRPHQSPRVDVQLPNDRQRAAASPLPAQEGDTGRGGARERGAVPPSREDGGAEGAGRGPPLGTRAPEGEGVRSAPTTHER